MILTASVYVLLLIGTIIASDACSRLKYGLYATATCAVIVGLFAWLVWNRPHILTLIIPGANAIVFANLFPFAAALAAPAAIRQSKTKAEKIRISVLMVLLLAASFSGTVRMFGKPAIPDSTQYFPDGTCRQSSIDTCSAAAGVTLLNENGVPATEREMAQLAFTKEGRGTHPLGLYRALKIKADQSTQSLQVNYRAVDGEKLLQKGVPAIVNVGLLHEPRTSLEQDLKNKYQWEPGVVHSVVLLGKAGSNVRIADPDFGIEDWSTDGFEALYQGTAIWIE